MLGFPYRPATRLLGASFLSIGLALAACSSSSTPNPVTPTPMPTPSAAAVAQRVTVTADGVFPTVLQVQPDYAVTIVNEDSVAHHLHLDVADQAGCTGFDAAGEIPPGETRLTSPLTDEAVTCDVHDHDRPGDSRFVLQLVMAPAY